MLAWQSDGRAYIYVAADGAIVRDDGTIVARPVARPAGVVLLGGAPFAVYASDGQCVVVDAVSGAERVRIAVVGVVDEARVVIVAGEVRLATAALSRVVMGATEQMRLELAWADVAGKTLHRIYHRAATAAELPRGSAALLADGTLLDGAHHTAALASSGVSLARPSKAPVVAVAGWSATEPVHLASSDGVIAAIGPDGEPMWAVTIHDGARPFRFERLALSGDRAHLFAWNHDTIAALDAATGALVGAARPTEPGSLHPAPTGRDAIWLGRAPKHIVLEATSLAARRYPIPERSLEDRVQDRAARVRTFAQPRRSPAQKNEALEAAIAEAPDDVRRHVVYGDWLLEAGDPRGELVIVQAGLTTHPNDATLRIREAELLALYGADWLGWYADPTQIVWRLGFVRELRSDQIMNRRRWQHLHALPVFRFLEKLVVPQVVSSLATTIATHPFPCLRALTIQFAPEPEVLDRLRAALPAVSITTR